jgi:hypothetical protein
MILRSRSKILGAEVTVKAIVFWYVTLDSLVEICVPFGGTCCLHLQGGYFENFYHITRRHIPQYGSFLG